MTITREHEVYIAGLGSYSPGEPIPFDRVEDVLGHITEAPPKVMRWVDRMRPIFKELLGIDSYYYSLDPETRKPTEDNVTMSVKAALPALEQAGIDAKDIDLIVYAGIVMENVCPPTSVLIQEALGIPYCAEYAIHSNCTSIYKAIQIASDLIGMGRYKNALIMTSQMSSAFLRAEHFNQEIVTKTELILRWFLCDGAGAMVMTSDKDRGKKAGGKQLRVVDTYIESVGLGLGPDMYCIVGGHRSSPLEIYKNGWHHLNQNFDRVSELAVKLAIEALNNMVQHTGIDLNDMTYFFANIPTRHLSDQVISTLKKDMRLDHLNFYTRLAERGYPGPCAVVIALDEFMRTEHPEPGDQLFSMVTESSKWMHGGFILEYLG